MSTEAPIPDYDLEDIRVVSSPQEIRAMAHPLRGAILELLLERAATVAQLAAVVDRAKGTVAYHVGVLVQAGLLGVVRTRRVRAIEERFYGRTARTFYVGAINPVDHGVVWHSAIDTAAAESAPAREADTMRTVLRHVSIPPERAAEFWLRVIELGNDFMQLPRSGDTVFGFVAGLYPTERPTLPEATPREDEN